MLNLQNSCLPPINEASPKQNSLSIKEHSHLQGNKNFQNLLLNISQPISDKPIVGLFEPTVNPSGRMNGLPEPTAHLPERMNSSPEPAVHPSGRTSGSSEPTIHPSERMNGSDGRTARRA